MVYTCPNLICQLEERFKVNLSNVDETASNLFILHTLEACDIRDLIREIEVSVFALLLEHCIESLPYPALPLLLCWWQK